ncbi:NADP-dependent 3-hydroxy acid dehydrogenase YdfG [Hydrogenophaga palleronii]|uniref:NADP-dependent 3-hydroxy acid dehydrogenase YdfG n=1 Tax=Hydrogenophaga palleronii TaxID=65655 RepID=A0ABU1WRF5_9BURK|nr:hypothetical protein [Hydrogenophaga palleronii]MDR7151890.1 NADP-dependent 3-hydroxy acid dehydrogenase YdfG [Hydrogenophaga palleronii]
MRLEGAVALVIGADSTMGAAVVRGLLVRGVSKVYADAPLESCEISLSRTVPLFVYIGKQARAATIARDLTDVTLLVNCLVADHSIESPQEGSDPLTLHPQGPTVGRTLNVIDAVAPVLAANGGGAIVNVMSVLHEQLSATKASTNARPLAEWLLADGLKGRLAAQRTQLLFFGAQLVVGAGKQMLDDQRALAVHVATRMLHQLDADNG